MLTFGHMISFMESSPSYVQQVKCICCHFCILFLNYTSSMHHKWEKTSESWIFLMNRIFDKTHLTREWKWGTPWGGRNWTQSIFQQPPYMLYVHMKHLQCSLKFYCMKINPQLWLGKLHLNIWTLRSNMPLHQPPLKHAQIVASISWFNTTITHVKSCSITDFCKLTSSPLRYKVGCFATKPTTTQHEFLPLTVTYEDIYIWDCKEIVELGNEAWHG